MQVPFVHGEGEAKVDQDEPGGGSGPHDVAQLQVRVNEPTRMHQLEATEALFEFFDRIEKKSQT